MLTDEEEENVIHRVRTLLNLRITSARDASASPGPQAGSKHGLDGIADRTSKWKKLFLSYDKDKSGTITFPELRSMLRLSLRVSESSCPDVDLKVIFSKLDEDDSGAIEFDEFCAFVNTRKAQSQEMPASLNRALRLAMSRNKVASSADLRGLFVNYDLDKDNFISQFEMSRFFREVLQLSSHEVSEFHIKKLFKSLDVDCTDSISYTEFEKWILLNVDLSKGRLGYVGARFGGTGPAATQATSQLPSVGAPGASRSGGLRPSSCPAGKISGPPQCSLGGRRTYLSIPGAERLNLVEERLFKAGFDVRGDFFKVRDAEASPLMRATLRGTGSTLSRSNSAAGRSGGFGGL